jgi:hypothetical protein
VAYGEIPYAREQGISKRVSGNLFRATGNLVAGAWEERNRPKLDIGR